MNNVDLSVVNIIRYIVWMRFQMTGLKSLIQLITFYLWIIISNLLIQMN